MTIQNTAAQNSLDTRYRTLQLFPFLCAAALLLFLALPATAHAADTRAVTVLSSNNSLGAVFCTINGTSFEHYTYAEPTDYITVNALSVNKNYSFLNWTDNGVIVSDASTYSFSVKDQNHVIVANFDSKSDLKHKRYDADKDISSITHNTNACSFASGYKINGMTINTALTPIDDTSRASLEAMTGGSFLSAFQINFTFGYNGTEKQTLDQTVRLVLQLPEAQTGLCQIVLLSSSAPILLEDLDNDVNTVTFDTNCSGLYVVMDAIPSADTLSAILPSATDIPAESVTDAAAIPVTEAALIPVTEPAATTTTDAAATTVTEPAATTTTDAATTITEPAITPLTEAAITPVTEEQYKNAIIDILRYQLQQAGITPAV